MQLRITIGDYFGDGHKNKESTSIRCSDNYTVEQLLANYNKNVEEFGMSPNEVMARDRILSNAGLEILASKGIEFVKDAGTDYVTNIERLKQNNLIMIDDVSKYSNAEEPIWELGVGEDDMVKIVMLYISYGLSGFQWSTLEEEIIDWNRLLKTDFGYDFFDED